MARNGNLSILVSELPAFLRDVASAELVAVALDEQASMLRASVQGAEPAYPAVVTAGILAQAERYIDAAGEVRLTAKTIDALPGRPS